MPAYTAHLDTFARDNLPPRAALARVQLRSAGVAVSGPPELRQELLDRAVARGLGDKPVFYTPNERWTWPAPGAGEPDRAGT